MKVLIVGNSQASCLKTAHDLHPGILGSVADIYFYVVPGGHGPAFSIENDCLNVPKGTFNPDFPPRVYPESTVTTLLSEYNAIVISALGYVDGGFVFNNPIVRQGVVHDFSPKENGITNRPLSRRCYNQLVHSALTAQQGFQFLVRLRKHYSKKIILQPFPMISIAIRHHSDWPLNQLYEDSQAAHEFFSESRDVFLRKICTDLSVDLLPYPREEWLNDHFTPTEFMNTKDGLHPNEVYGKMVNEQIAKILVQEAKFSGLYI